VVARDLLLVAVGVYSPSANPIGEPIHAMSLANPVNGGIGCLDAVIALQVPHDPNRPHVICPAQVQDLLDNLVGCLVWVVVMTTPSAALQPLVTRLTVTVSL
jgi:hypothetical protein